jgi:DNA-binding response OmpR family regulator
VREETRILVIEDEEKIARFLELELSHEGYTVEVAGTGRRGIETFEEKNFHLVLLDIMLPELSGTEVCRRIRRGSDIPIIMLTAKAGTSDKVLGLDMGADDYITKPFQIEELLARIRAALRRKDSGNRKEGEYRVADLVLNQHTKAVRRGDTPISLTKREFELLRYFLENLEIVLNRETLLKHVWGWDYYNDTNTVDVYVRYLRNKIDAPFPQKLIHTVRGFGYVLKDYESR